MTERRYDLTIRCTGGFVSQEGCLLEVRGIPKDVSPGQVIKRLSEFFVLGPCVVSFGHLQTPDNYCLGHKQ